MSLYKDDRFLARWLNDELTEAELAEFENSEDFVHYRKIVDAVDNVEPAEVNAETLLEKIKSNSLLEHPSRNTQSWYYGIAASIAVLIGIFFFTDIFKSGTKTLSAGYGEKTRIELPDGSFVTLNARSQITYNEKNWSSARELDLKGEAFFEVTKGSTFSVKTKNGLVTVVGTKFNIKDETSFYQVICYEGAVKVEHGNYKDLLKAGDGIQSVNSETTTLSDSNITQPSWITGQSTFNGAPVVVVLNALQNQYNITLKGKLPIGESTFTGTFPHDDMKVSLKIVLGSLQIDYQIEDEKNVILRD